MMEHCGWRCCADKSENRGRGFGGAQAGEGDGGEAEPGAARQECGAAAGRPVGGPGCGGGAPAGAAEAVPPPGPGRAVQRGRRSGVAPALAVRGFMRTSVLHAAEARLACIVMHACIYPHSSVTLAVSANAVFHPIFLPPPLPPCSLAYSHTSLLPTGSAASIWPCFPPPILHPPTLPFFASSHRFLGPPPLLSCLLPFVFGSFTFSPDKVSFGGCLIFRTTQHRKCALTPCRVHSMTFRFPPCESARYLYNGNAQPRLRIFVLFS